MDSEKIKSLVSNRKLITNCFAFCKDILKWKEESRAYFYEIEGNLFIFLKANGFYKFYYFVNAYVDISFAKSVLDKHFKEKNISLEFTTKHRKNLDVVSNALQNVGFVFYSEFARLVSGQSNISIEDEKISFQLAQEKDINALIETMHREFDPIIDDIPTKEELKLLIKSESIILRYKENKLIFIQIFQRKKGVLYSRMTWIEKKYRKPRYSVAIYNEIDAYLEYLNISNESHIRAYYWVDVSNKNFKIGQKLGSKPDGLTCTTFVYQNK